MSKVKLITGIALLSLPALSFAVMPLPMGWYVEGNAGSSKVSNTDFASPSSTSSSGRGWNVNIGYKAMPYFAAEAGYTGYAQIKSTTSGTQVATADDYAIDLAAKGILPLGVSGAEVFAKLGAARISSRVKSTNPGFSTANNVSIQSGTSYTTGYYFGLGADYNFLPSFSGLVQWQRAQGNNRIGNLDLYTVGLAYLFG